MNAHRNLPLRIIGALLVLAGGVVHVRLVLADFGYADKIERMFLANAAASVAAAVLIVVWSHWLAPLAGLAVVNGTLLAFALSRTNRGFQGLYESGWNPSPEAALALAFEIGAAAVLIMAMVVEARGQPATSAAAPSTAVGLSPWAPPGGPPPSPPAPW